MIRDNLVRLRDDISSICKGLGRNPEEIILVGVTKYADSSQVKEAVEGGLTHIGENKVQEAKEKFLILNDLNVSVTRHMIGHLQTNKVKQALENFDLIQSVDSQKLIREIDKQAKNLDRQANILIQVNMSGEEQKFGIRPSEIDLCVNEISRLQHVCLQGLMAMAPLVEDRAVIRQSFRDLKVLFDQVKEKYSEPRKVVMKFLSMGMTNDYHIALEEGANIIRIGRAIFHREGKESS